MNFGNATDWVKVYENSFQAEMLPYYPKQHIPLPDVILPFTFTKNVIAVESTSTIAKSTWKRGIRVHPTLNVTGLFDLTLRYYNTELNKTNLILFTNIVTDYKLRLSIPKWFYDISVKIWEYQHSYQGNVELALNNISQLVLENRENIALIQAQLDRIEQDINTTYGQ